MKRWAIRLGLLAGYGLPYAYFALWGDAHGTMGLYALMAAALSLLGFIAARTGNGAAAILGCACSWGTSALMLSRGGLDGKAWYFKPLTAGQLIAVLFLAALAGTLAMLRMGRRHKA